MLASWLLLLALSYTANAETPCFDEKAAARLTNGIRVQLEDREAKPLCDRESHAYKLTESLVLMKGIKFLPRELPRPYNQSILPLGFWKYFAEPTARIADADAHSPNCTDGALAFAHAVQGENTVYLCPEFFAGDQSSLDRVSTLLHEVRHFSGYAHVRCTRGLLAGQESGCDEALSDKGAYAVDVESFTKMALLARRLSPMQKQYAKVSAISYAETRINRPSAAVHALYLRSVEGRAYYFDGKTVVAAPYVQGAAVARRDRLAVFPSDRSDAFSLNLLSSRLLKEPADGVASLRFNQSVREERTEVMDILTNAKLSCSVQPRELVCNIPNSAQDYTVRVPGENKFPFLAEELGLAGGAVYLADDQGQITKVQFSEKGESEISTFSSPAIRGFRAISLLEGDRFGLTKAGEIQQWLQGRWMPVTALSGRRFQSMSRAVEWNGFFYGK